MQPHHVLDRNDGLALSFPLILDPSVKVQLLFPFEILMERLLSEVVDELVHSSLRLRPVLDVVKQLADVGDVQDARVSSDQSRDTACFDHVLGQYERDVCHCDQTPLLLGLVLEALQTFQNFFLQLRKRGIYQGIITTNLHQKKLENAIEKYLFVIVVKTSADHHHHQKHVKEIA